MDNLTGLLDSTSWKVLTSLLSLLILFLIKFITLKIIDKRIDHFRRRYFLRQTLNYLFWFLLILTLIVIWVEWFMSVITLLSLVFGAFVIVSKEAVLNLMANGVIIWRGIFQVGDRIEIDGITGDVIETGPMYITLSELGSRMHGDSSTGRIVKVPNSFVLYKPIWNFSKGAGVIWNEITFNVKRTADINSLKMILMSILHEISYKFTDDQIRELIESSTDIMFLNKEPEIFINLEQDKTIVTARYLTKFHKRRESENHFWELLFAKSKDDLL